ncbi:AraC family transcriptional regulator [Methylobacterium mesophilicum]
MNHTPARSPTPRDSTRQGTALADPGCTHLSIGALAYGCGFANQAHFARRFKARYGMAPSEHRHAALMNARPGPTAPAAASRRS